MPMMRWIINCYFPSLIIHFQKVNKTFRILILYMNFWTRNLTDKNSHLLLTVKKMIQPLPLLLNVLSLFLRKTRTKYWSVHNECNKVFFSFFCSSFLKIQALWKKKKITQKVACISLVPTHSISLKLNYELQLTFLVFWFPLGSTLKLST